MDGSALDDRSRGAPRSFRSTDREWHTRRNARRWPAPGYTRHARRPRGLDRRSRLLATRVARGGPRGYAFDAKTPLGKPASQRTVAEIEKAVGGPLPVSTSQERCSG